MVPQIEAQTVGEKVDNDDEDDHVVQVSDQQEFVEEEDWEGSILCTQQKLLSAEVRSGTGPASAGGWGNRSFAIITIVDRTFFGF